MTDSRKRAKLFQNEPRKKRALTKYSEIEPVLISDEDSPPSKRRKLPPSIKGEDGRKKLMKTVSQQELDRQLMIEQNLELDKALEEDIKRESRERQEKKKEKRKREAQANESSSFPRTSSLPSTNHSSLAKSSSRSNSFQPSASQPSVRSSSSSLLPSHRSSSSSSSSSSSLSSRSSSSSSSSSSHSSRRSSSSSDSHKRMRNGIESALPAKRTKSTSSSKPSSSSSSSSSAPPPKRKFESSSLEQEPGLDEPSENVVSIRIRFPNGVHKNRRFQKSCAVPQLYCWAESLFALPELTHAPFLRFVNRRSDYRLCPFPAHLVELDPNSDSSLEEVGLSENTLLHFRPAWTP